MRKSMLTLAMFVALPFAAQAEVYCVGSAAQLRSAFSGAADSPSASEIRVKSGFYALAPLNGQSVSIQYVASSDLSMSGGWAGTNCTSQVLDPEDTVLSAESAGSLLRFFLISGQATQIGLSNFSFRQASGVAASCLTIESDVGSDAVVRIDRNAFRLCTRTGSSAGSAIRASARSVDLYLRNNVFADNASISGAVSLSGFGGSVFYVSNNTFANNPQLGAGGGPGGVQISALASDLVWFTNNVLWNNGTGSGYDLLVNTGAPIALNNNLIGEHAPFPAGSISNNNLVGVDPRFTNSVDFRPLASSPLRNGGIGPVGGLLERDFFGEDREQGTRVDRGAHEFREVFANGFE